MPVRTVVVLIFRNFVVIICSIWLPVSTLNILLVRLSIEMEKAVPFSRVLWNSYKNKERTTDELPALTY